MPPRDRHQAPRRRRFPMHDNVQRLSQIYDRIDLLAGQNLAALKLPERVHEFQRPDGGHVQPLTAHLPPDTIGISRGLIAHKPGHRHAGVDDHRHYSLPSSISFCRFTLRRARQVLLNSMI